MVDEAAGGQRSGTQGVSKSPVVFVADASAEAARIGQTLKGVGYIVADVPIAMLPARVAVQRPNVVLLDIDHEGMLGEIAKVRRMPGTAAIDFIYVGAGEGPVRSAEDALANDGSAFFLRPVDVAALVRKLESLTGGPAAAKERRGSSPPPSLPAPRPSSPSLPAPGARTPGPPLPMSTPSLAELVDPPRSLATFGTVSDELQQLLADAELRAEVHSSPDAPVPSPEEEIEAVLPADVLASLDEPIDGDEDDDGGPDAPRVNPETQPGRDAHTKGTTATGGGRQATTGSGGHERRVSSEAPAPSPQQQATTTSHAPTTTPTGRRASEAAPAPPPPDEAPRPALPVLPRTETLPSRSSWAPPAPPPPSAQPSRMPSVRPAAPEAGTIPAGVVLGHDDARRFFADAIARRATGALCFQHDDVVRRVVLRDGDFVTAASGAEQESLVHFLGARGELPRDEVARLSEKVPPHGRHAGAALVAHGWLRQDQLWTVLRAHAEWIASAILRLEGGTVQLEAEPPGRLKGEPSVFAASTGPEIFVELVRRAVPPEEALERLGGEGSRIGDGPNQGLLAECNLPPHDAELLARARGGSIADLLARSPDAEIVSAIHALALLGVVEVVPSPDFGRGTSPANATEIAALDEEAIRARVRARLELVEEGDYFAVLGVSRDATSYEIRRAFVDLRRAFEPSRILTPRLADLAADVRKIVVVLDEAYEILRDAARRERYRRAIEARPQ